MSNNLYNRALEIINRNRFGGFLAIVAQYTVQEIYVLLNSFSKLNNFKSESIKDAVDICFNSFHAVIRPGQVKSEITELLQMLEAERPSVAVEIGTAKGGTLFLFCRIAMPKAVIISIDLPWGKFGGGYPLWRIPFYNRFKLPGQQLYLLRADSHDHSTVQKFSKILSGRQVDFLFIDGDHTYQGVKKDFEVYSRFVRDGGIIALHDILMNPSEKGCEVNRFWDEIKAKGYQFTELIEDKDQGACGIGVIFWQK